MSGTLPDMSAKTKALEATTFIYHPARCPALTPLQQEAVNALGKLTRERGEPPTLLELAEVLHVTIKPLWQRLRAAERKGYVTRRHGYARSLRVVEASK